ncbi:MAG: Fe-S cluster assembly protein HesB [Methanoculleus sp. SDB]|nr:MAG: Fe-S cluster assembly protein HesB [Methanoculleus sp. SDB]
MSASGSCKCEALIGALSALFGDLAWWPGTPEEVMIGAVLTQQTRWENVTAALDALRRKGICSIAGIHAAPSSVIEEAVRCTGFFRVKTRRLTALAEWITHRYGSVDAMRKRPTEELRAGLLSVNGIGAETADSILCYALDRPVFVIDAYTERICGCVGIPERGAALKRMFEAVLPPDTAVHRRCHAYFVEYAKQFCGKKRCETCILKNAFE